MLKSIDEILIKKVFTIQDLSFILGKQSQTIRKWEQKGIIPKCKKYNNAGWREYNRNEFANILEIILNHNWKRNIIYNPGKVQIIINYLRGR